jgi:hypothetical protein
VINNYRREHLFDTVGRWNPPATASPSRPSQADLVDQLKPVLVAQGSPPIYVSRENGALVFVSPTGEFMLRARVADALTEVCADWRARAV